MSADKPVARRRRDSVADPSSTSRPSRRGTARTATLPAASDAPISEDQLDAAILRQLRRQPNRTVDLATLTEKGLRWLIAREGGKPVDVPVALRPAKERVRAEDEAARLPRAQVYGVRERS